MTGLISMPASFCLSCRCPLLARVWEADLEACQLLVQSLWLQEAGSGPHADDEKQVDSIGEATWTASLAVHPRPHPEEEKTPSQVSRGQNTHSAPLPHGAGGQQREVCPVCVAVSGSVVWSLGLRTNRTGIGVFPQTLIKFPEFI